MFGSLVIDDLIGDKNVFVARRRDEQTQVVALIPSSLDITSPLRGTGKGLVIAPGLDSRLAHQRDRAQTQAMP